MYQFKKFMYTKKRKLYSDYTGTFSNQNCCYKKQVFGYKKYNQLHSLPVK